MKITVVCSYPPPYAGMSIYADRFSAYLTEKGHDCKVIDIGRGKEKDKAKHVLSPSGGRFLKFFSAMWLILRNPCDVVHVNCSSYGNFWGSQAICVFTSFLSCKTVLTIHGGKFPKRVAELGKLGLFMARFGLSFPDFVIAVNDEIERVVRRLGVPENRTAVIPVFCLAYLSDTVPKSLLPAEYLDFSHSRHPILISATGTEQAYGFESLIQALSKLKQDYPDAGLFVLGIDKSSSKHAQMVEALRLADDVLFAGDVIHPITLTLCKELSDVIIRPALADGDSSFVREAIALRKPVVASDTDFRPKGPIIFKKGDPDDLASKIDYAIKNADSIVAELESIDHPDRFAETVELYERVLASSGGKRAKDRNRSISQSDTSDSK